MNLLTETDFRAYYGIYVRDCLRLRVPFESEHTFINECLGLQGLFGPTGVAQMLSERGQLGSLSDIDGGLQNLLLVICRPDLRATQNKALWLASRYQDYLEACAMADAPAYDLADMQKAIMLPGVELMNFHGTLVERVARLMRDTEAVPQPIAREMVNRPLRRRCGGAAHKTSSKGKPRGRHASNEQTDTHEAEARAPQVQTTAPL